MSTKPPAAGDDPAPRGATRNWQPATTIGDYLRNCQEGLESYSEHRAADLLGWPRIKLHRARAMAEIPKELFERLLAVGILSIKELAAIGLALQGRRKPEVERCPHCGGVLRVGPQFSDRAHSVIRQLLDDFDAAEEPSDGA